MPMSRNDSKPARETALNAHELSQVQGGASVIVDMLGLQRLHPPLPLRLRELLLSLRAGY